MPTTLVLLPGMDGTGVFFADFVAAMPPEYKPVVVAYPNDPKLGYSELETLARAALPQDRPFIVLGESFSGPIAISIAASNPQGLLGLILCCTFARNPHPLLPLATAAIRPFPAVRLPAFILHRNLFGRFNSPRHRARLQEVGRLVSSSTLKSRLEAVARIDVSDKLRRVAVPILYLRAKRDRVVSGASCRYIKKIRPDVEVADLDAPHLFLLTVPERALAIIENFAGRLTSSTAGSAG
jgi:pimeloyl-[acyl-carrier protein] methyl ester esterase